MTTTVYAAKIPKTNLWIETQRFNQFTAACGPRQCVRGDPKDTVPVPFHEPLKEASHTTLQVRRAVSPGPEIFPVNVFNGSTGKNVSVIVRSTDTIAKLQLEFLKLRPDFIGNLNLVFNGKPVKVSQTLCDLQVKPEATFITFQKCHGG